MTEEAIADKFEPSPLINLPEEIWSMIYEYISQKDLLLQRLVSKDWCKQVDNLAKYRVKFHDGQEGDLVARLLVQRVRACEFSGLKNTFEPTFQNPLLLKEITFASGCAAENVQKILSTCTDVERLTFYTTLFADRLFDLTQDHSAIWTNLKKIKEVEIGIQCFQTRRLDSKSSIFETVIGNSEVQLASLRRLSICFPMFSYEWESLFKFLARHSKTLKSLKVRCFRCPDGSDDISDVVINSLKKLNLSTLEVICDSGCKRSKVHAAFTLLVSSQRKLEKVNLDLIKCPLQVYIDTVHNCQSTLRSVKFYHVEFGADYRIHGSLFSECSLLRELILHCIPRYTVIITLEGDDDGIGNHMNPNPRYEGADVHGWSLPNSLISLSLKGCHIPTNELVALSNEDNCNNLEELELLSVGSSMQYGYGLTFDAFMELCENLQNLKVFTFRGMCFTGSFESEQKDKVKWRRMLEYAAAMGVCRKNDEESGLLEWADDDETCFTFKFQTSDRRKNFRNDIRKMLSDVEDCDGPAPKRIKTDQ